jgi:hypothetical protein
LLRGRADPLVLMGPKMATYRDRSIPTTAIHRLRVVPAVSRAVAPA